MLSLHVYVAAALLFTHHGYSQKQGDSCVVKHTNNPGVCAPAISCQSARRDYQTHGITPTFCNSSLLSSIICCSDESSILNTAPDNSSRPVWSNNNQQTTTVIQRLSEKKCEEYIRLNYKNVTFIPLLPDSEPIAISISECDYVGVELIVGGGGVETGEFPHMAAIGWVNFEGTYSFLCDGSLISTKFVLTAAHCTRNSKMRNPNPVIVRLGDQNLDPTKDDNANPYEIPIKNIRKHPQYKSPGKYHDIALLELASDIVFDAAVKPACLWNRSDFTGYTKAVATGWRIVDPHTLRTSDELQKVSLTLLEDGFCNDVFRIKTTHLDPHRLTDNQMCAGDLRERNDLCQYFRYGTSGSPLQVSLMNSCVFHLIGVTSFGANCNQSGGPFVYTRVSSYLDWIESVVWPGES